jgi:hypothetical protein
MLDAKWTGTEIDRREMRTLKLQQVVRVSALTGWPFSSNWSQRNFGAFAMFGFSTTLLCTWEAIARYASS